MSPWFSTGFSRWWREFRNAALDIVLPPHCPGCGEASAGLCDACRGQLAERTRPQCERCGEPLLVATSSCAADHRALTGLAWARAPYEYAGTGGALVRRLKLSGDFGAGLALARAMAGAAADRLHGAWRRAALVAVPLHRSRRRRRGFDQAWFLASQLGKRLELPALPGVMRRLRPTMPQGDPRVLSRVANVEAAFEVVRPRLVRGRQLILVDDVLTSGATARACAAALVHAGAAEVALVTACRA